MHLNKIHLQKIIDPQIFMSTIPPSVAKDMNKIRFCLFNLPFTSVNNILFFCLLSPSHLVDNKFQNLSLPFKDRTGKIRCVFTGLKCLDSCCSDSPPVCCYEAPWRSKRQLQVLLREGLTETRRWTHGWTSLEHPTDCCPVTSWLQPAHSTTRECVKYFSY